MESQIVIVALTEVISGGVAVTALLILRRSYREALEVTRNTLDAEKTEVSSLRGIVDKLGTKLDDVGRELRQCQVDHHKSELQASSLEHRIFALEEQTGGKN